MKNRLGMPPYWRGGVPTERGDYPAVLEWRPQVEKTDNPEIFQGWIADMEIVLASAGLSLVTQQTGGGTIIFSAAGRKVAEAKKGMFGFEGTVYSRPVGGPGPGIRGQMAAEQIRRSSQWLGYGQAPYTQSIRTALATSTTPATTPTYTLAPSVREEMYRASAMSIPILQRPPVVEPSGAAKAKMYGGAALGGLGVLGGLALLIGGKGLGRGAQIGAGIASAGAAGGGTILSVAGVKQKNEEQEAAEKAWYEEAGREAADVLPTLPQAEIIEEALSRCNYLKRTIIVPGVPVTSDSGITPFPGDWEATVYDRERKAYRTVLCSDIPREGMQELKMFYVSDPGAGVASVKNHVAFEEHFNPGKGYYEPQYWGRGDKLPSSVRNAIWALPTMTPDGGPRGIPIVEYIASLAASMNKPMPRWVMGYSGERGGPLVGMERAFMVQTDLWKDVFRNVVIGVIKMAVAIIVGFLAGGPIGSALAEIGLAVSVVVAEIIGIVGYMAYEAYNIYKEVKKTGRISGSLEDGYQLFAMLTAASDTLKAYVAQFEHELYGVMGYIDQARDAGKAILAQYRTTVTWANGIEDELERMGAQMVVGIEGSLAAFASNISGRAKKKVPWDIHGGAVRLLEAKIEAGTELAGTLPPVP